MIEKKRTIPLKILILEALLRRLPKNFIKRRQIEEELSRRRAGYKGEESLDFYLNSLDEKKYMIFHDLNFSDGKYNYQIDTLLLTSKFALIIEVKNMAGKLIFDTEHDQFIQIIDGKEKGYTDPIAQSQRHQTYLKKLLGPLPVDYLIVSSNPHSILSFIGKSNAHIKQRVCKSHSLIKKVQFFEDMFTNEIHSTKELRKISRTLIKMNTPPTSHILETYGIKKSDQLTGIHCPSCFYLPLTREKRKWYCPSCQTYSIDAHIFALQDYFLLIGLNITNEQFRQFAHLNSANTAKRLLRSENLISSGTNKGRVYLPDTIPFRDSILRI